MKLYKLYSFKADMENPAAAVPPPTADRLREALRAVVDPEAGINIVDLGLVYGIDIDGAVVRVALTMTSPACPMGEMIADDVESTLRAVLPEGMQTDVQLVWLPPWEPSMMSDKARSHFEW